MSQPTPCPRILGPDAISGVAELLTRSMPTKNLLLLCDDITWVAAGENVFSQLLGKTEITPHSFGRRVSPSLALAEDISARAREVDGVIAVGSGTINDIAKYASARANKPYIAVATAASMNGYTSPNASLEENGFKHSFAAKPPIAVVADTTVIAAAPKRMTRAGLADTLCRSTVEVDMILSDAIRNTGYPRALFDTMRSHESGLITNAPLARNGDPAFVGLLMAALLDAGDAMHIHGSSAPASQSEHMIAHTIEVLYGAETRSLLHGEMIAPTTLTMNQLQHKILLGSPTVRSLPRELVQFERLFGKKLGPQLAERYVNKVIQAEEAQHINARLETQWPDIKAVMGSIMLPSNTIERAFMQSGLALQASEIGLNAERYRTACTYAYLTRDRFTFLDLAAMNDKRVS